MPIPAELKGKNQVVFCYSTDCRPAARKLAEFLAATESSVTLCEITVAKGTVSTFPEPEKAMAGKVGWLVGHGQTQDDKIGTPSLTNYVVAGDVLDWLKNNGYEAVVDTCCEPDARCAIANQSSFKDILAYYGTVDGGGVTMITGFTSLPLWWDHHQMSKRN